MATRRIVMILDSNGRSSPSTHHSQTEMNSLPFVAGGGLQSVVRHRNRVQKA
jgi:hypothetical protein